MSYKYNPEWAEIYVGVDIEFSGDDVNCPHCGKSQQEEFIKQVKEYTEVS